MGRAAYIRKRLLLMVFVLFGVTVVIFGMVRILPGDPAFLILGDRATDQKAAELRELLGLTLRWFPVAGFGETLAQHVWYLFLPALTLALQLSAVLIRNLRGQIILTLRSDYVRTAHAKGLSESLVLLRHVLRNALLSTLTIFGLQFGFLVGGAIVVETVFALPGTGQLLIQSITARDYPVVQAITVISAVLVIVVNLVVDLSYSFLDPRATYEW